jgi:hypothetical protein
VRGSAVSGATLRNPTGPALHADRLQTDSGVLLDEGFTAEGTNVRGAVRLLGARIGGPLVPSSATLRNPTGPALNAEGLQTDSDVYLDEGFTAEGAGDDGAVRLLGGRIGGQLHAGGCAVSSKTKREHRWVIDGLAYSGVPQLAREGNREAWLELLRAGTPRYAAQPYQQLAAAYRAEGHDSDVRVILIAQRQDQVVRSGLSWPDRWWARTAGALLGYGYQPWRALLYLAGIPGRRPRHLGRPRPRARRAGRPRPHNLSCASASSSSTTIPAPVPAPCTLVQTIGRGLDLGAPFLPVAPAVAGSCQPTASPAGAALTISRWVLQLAAWALAALFIAGFTGIVRKT